MTRAAFRLLLILTGLQLACFQPAKPLPVHSELAPLLDLPEGWSRDRDTTTEGAIWFFRNAGLDGDSRPVFAVRIANYPYAGTGERRQGTVAGRAAEWSIDPSDRRGIGIQTMWSTALTIESPNAPLGSFMIIVLTPRTEEQRLLALDLLSALRFGAEAVGPDAA